MGTLLQNAAIIIFIHATLWYVIALKYKRNDVADIAWGLGFIWLVCYAALSAPLTPFNVILYVLVTLWALRLTIHIGMRNFRKGQEDFRYRNWRLQWGKTFYWRTYLQVFLLQGFFQWIISLPIWIAATSGFDFMNFLLRPDMPGNLIPGRYHEATILFGAALWLLGFLFQAIGDYQLARFSKTKQPGQIMQSGLWKYSRHPNYFGEICMWWGIWLMVASFPNGAWAIISPVTITWLLAKVSGVPMLEKKYEGNPDFEAYKKRTPALFPWKPRKKEIN
ncbi:MAG: DUF1295 domain-containing protein [Chitinophagaceae bacterium]|nr:DUF1295 domain-containing protein [Chitinophagaceae bacterium]